MIQQPPPQQTSEGGNSTYKKTTKKFPYNNRKYTIYKYKTKQEFIIMNKVHTLTSNLKKQTYRTLTKKTNYNGEKYEVFEILKDKRKFIIVNRRKKYLKL
jgi:hypothetical protein